MKPHRRARLGLARTFQRLELFGSLTAGENVQVGLESAVKWWQWGHLRRAFPWRRAGRRADAAGEHGGMGSTAAGHAPTGCSKGSASRASATVRPSAMSTGLARMVELARALAIGPKLLLLDEPGSGLDESRVEGARRAAPPARRRRDGGAPRRARHGAGHADLRLHLRPRLRRRDRRGHARTDPQRPVGPGRLPRARPPPERASPGDDGRYPVSGSSTAPAEAERRDAGRSSRPRSPSTGCGRPTGGSRCSTVST